MDMQYDIVINEKNDIIGMVNVYAGSEIIKIENMVEQSGKLWSNIEHLILMPFGQMSKFRVQSSKITMEIEIEIMCHFMRMVN
jgi:tRNA A22 N-methylase